MCVNTVKTGTDHLNQFHFTELP